MNFPTATVILLLSHLGLGSPVGDKSSSTNSTLKWAPCDLDFPSTQQAVIDAHGVPLFCTTLKVPLDYSNPKNGRTLDLQLIKVEATKEPVKGSIIFNPGGPGASGVEEVTKSGPLYRDVFGGQFNVIGFDARGTGRTLPFACNPVNANASLSRRATNFTIPQTDMFAVLESKAFHDAGLFVDACADTEGADDIAHLISTPFVVRDMVAIVDALGEDGLLRFWGRSYSTVLGQTFAAMFPNRVGRILLDSVLRLDDYYSGQWSTTTRETETSLLNVFRECISAGPEICPIANFTGPNTTPESLRLELAAALQELLDSPIILPNTYQPLSQPWWQPGTTLYQELKYWMLVFLYRPEQFPCLLTFLDTALRRDWDSLATNPCLFPPATNASNATTPEIPWDLGINNFHGIACSDASFRANNTKDMYSFVQAQAAQGSWADVFSPQIWPCAQWPWRAAETFKGPFTGIKTKNPLLLVNGRYDPITPLSGAWEAAAALEGSRLVVHGGHGHGVMNHPSNCTIKAIHDYFNDGTLPEVGTLCEPNQSGFEVALQALLGAGA